MFFFFLFARFWLLVASPVLGDNLLGANMTSGVNHSPTQLPSDRRAEPAKKTMDKAGLPMACSPISKSKSLCEAAFAQCAEREVPYRNKPTHKGVGLFPVDLLGRLLLDHGLLVLFTEAHALELPVSQRNSLSLPRSMKAKRMLKGEMSMTAAAAVVIGPWLP